MPIKLIEQLKKYSARNLVKIEAKDVYSKLYPVNHLHTAEKVEVVKARQIKPTNINFNNIKEFRIHHKN